MLDKSESTFSRFSYSINDLRYVRDNSLRTTDEEEIPVTGRKKVEDVATESDCQRGSEPRIPRMASRLTRRTALSVELACIKSGTCTANEKHDQRSGGWKLGTREKLSDITQWYESVANGRGIGHARSRCDFNHEFLIEKKTSNLDHLLMMIRFGESKYLAMNNWRGETNRST